MRFRFLSAISMSDKLMCYAIVMETGEFTYNHKNIKFELSNFHIRNFYDNARQYTVAIKEGFCVCHRC
jgi:hypothetical protein